MSASRSISLSNSSATEGVVAVMGISMILKSPSTAVVSCSPLGA